MSEFKRVLGVTPPFDKRSPNPRKSYGIGSLRLYFAVVKDNKAVSVTIGTNSYLNSVLVDYSNSVIPIRRKMYLNKADYQGFMAFDIVWHKSTRSKKKGYECDLFKSGKCEFESSGIKSSQDKVAEIFVEQGEDGVWDYLEKEWKIKWNKELKNEGDVDE